MSPLKITAFLALAAYGSLQATGVTPTASSSGTRTILDSKGNTRVRHRRARPSKTPFLGPQPTFTRQQGKPEPIPSLSETALP